MEKKGIKRKKKRYAHDARGYVIRRRTRSVTALYIKGYAPGESVVDLLPNVTRVYSTSGCVGPAYYAVCAKGGYDGSNERPWPLEIDESYWDVDSDEFMIVRRGESPRLESDAPTRYECSTDSDDYTDSANSADSADSTDSTESADSADSADCADSARGYAQSARQKKRNPPPKKRKKKAQSEVSVFALKMTEFF